MKILFFHRWTGVHFGGTETHVVELMERFSKRGHEVGLLTRSGDRVGQFNPSIKVYAVSKNLFESDHSYETVFFLYWHTFLFMVKSFFTLVFLRIFLGQKFEVISVHFATEALVCRLYRRLFGTPFVFILEGYTPLEGSVAKTANLAIAISKQIINSAQKNNEFEPILVPLGVNERFNRKVDGGDLRDQYLQGAEKLLIAVGRVEPRKDYPTLLETARLLKDEGKNYRWLIVGSGIDFEKIGDLIKSRQLGQTVIMTGPVSDAVLPQLYRAADLFVLPTLYEGFGIVFIEALSSGLPIVSTRVGAVEEVVGGAALLVEPKNPVQLARAVRSVLEDEKLYDTLKQEANKLSVSFDWEKLIVKYEIAYQSVIKK